MSTFTQERLREYRGAPVYGAEGEKIGDLQEFYVDGGTRRPEWASVSAGFLGMSTKLVPLEGAEMHDDGIHVAYTKDVVKDAPDASGDEIDVDEERELYRHYGLAPTTETEGYTEPRPTPDEAELTGHEGSITRHEEELSVGKREVPAGHVRLRKWVESEPVEADVELEREHAEVRRERIDEPTDRAELGEEEIDVPLRAEEPVAGKRTVAKERIGVEKGVEREHHTVEDEVRRERVDVDEETR